MAKLLLTLAVLMSDFRVCTQPLLWDPGIIVLWLLLVSRVFGRHPLIVH